MQQFRAFVGVLVVVLATSCASGYQSRLEILALLQTLNADILASSSATAALERWCREHEMAAQPAIVARTDTPFGKAVRELKPYRRTLEARLLWSPLPQGWEVRGRAAVDRKRLAIPKEVLVHTAILYTADHQPFSEVVETYQGALFAFRRR